MVTSLHGTELKWLAAHGEDAEGTPGHGWSALMRKWSTFAHSITVVGESDAVTAARYLPVKENRIAIVGSGVDAEKFRPHSIASGAKLALWRKWLIEDPRGWDESGRPGSIAYTDSDLKYFVNSSTGKPKPVLIFVGRFTAVKRLPLLLTAYARLRARLGESTPPLVVWGGAPGEWEGPHPLAIVKAQKTEGVFFIGSRGHDELPLGLSCSDLLVAPSVNESFGQVYVESLACGVAVIASNSGGPATFLQPRNGRQIAWLVQPDDGDALLAAILDALSQPEERVRRACAGRAAVLAEHTWPTVASRLEQSYASAIDCAMNG
jgi:glycosyltransferase involved in cell wall biosynthesis